MACLRAQRLGRERRIGLFEVLVECIVVIGYAKVVIASRDRLSFKSRKRSEKLINKIKEIVELK